jgi:hypothetical protein
MALDKETINCWKINYGLDDKTPGEAANWWSDRLDGKAPAGAVAALGVALDEIARVTAERDETAAKLAVIRDVWIGAFYNDRFDRIEIDGTEAHDVDEALGLA